MLRLLEIKLPIDHSENDLKFKLLELLKISASDLIEYRVHKKSIDARKHRVVTFIYIVDVEVKNQDALFDRLKTKTKIEHTPDMTYKLVAAAPPVSTRPVIIGTGPSGLFAGLILAQMGFCPVLFERGKSANDRAADVYRFWKSGLLDPQSNVQFGEGGAGTFSDGKLTTQIKDRQNRCQKVLTELVSAGAPQEIMYLNKPHLGTDNLIRIVKNIRNTIISLGGQVRFETNVTDLIINNGRIAAVVIDEKEQVAADCVVLAIGHSARDTFEMLYTKGVSIEPKPFSVGLRIEHPQKMIDKSQFGDFAGHPKLGPADYKLVHHCQNNRTVYTFCMCPGGQVIAASSEMGGIVTNGMSAFFRNKVNANSALLVPVTTSDFDSDHPLAGIYFQHKYEQKAFELGGSNYYAPVQLVQDFLIGRPSDSLGFVEPSYKPGFTLTDLTPCLPEYVIASIKEAITAFSAKLTGFAMPTAVLTGVETRSSCPLRILRNEDYESISTTGLFPAGEGAGYAGGIISSAVDGIKVAEAVAAKITRKTS